MGPLGSQWLRMKEEPHDRITALIIRKRETSVFSPPYEDTVRRQPSTS